MHNFLGLFFLSCWQKYRTMILIVWHLAEILCSLSVTTVGNHSHFIKTWLTTEQNPKSSKLEISTPKWHFSRNLSISRKAISDNKIHRLLYPFWIKMFNQETELFVTNLSAESTFSDHGALMKMQDGCEGPCCRLGEIVPWDVGKLFRRVASKSRVSFVRWNKSLGGAEVF